MKVALCQFDSRWEDRMGNLARAGAFISMAAEAGCDLIVFPEMFTSGYSMNMDATAEPADGPTTSLLSSAAREGGINIIGGYVVRDSAMGSARNCAVVIDRSGNCAARYAKLHPFSLVDEGRYCAAGNNTVVFPIDGARASVFICYDLRFPEVFRRVAKDVQVIVVIASWPAARKDHWEVLLRARAIENQCFIIGVNRTGTDGNGIEYSGASCIIDPGGRDVCAGTGDELVIGEFDPLETDRARAEYPFLDDMRFI